MKTHIFKILFVFFTTIFITSCGENEFTTYDDSIAKPLIGFSNTTAALPVSERSSTTIQIPVDVSTTSSSERTFPVSVESTELDPSAYSLGVITIPANSYNGTLEVTGDDVNVSTEVIELLVKIDENDDYTFSNGTISIEVFEDNPFTGEYLIEQITDIPDGVGATLGNQTIVSIKASGDNAEFRSFETVNYPNFCPSTLISFTFELKNDNTISLPLQPTSCGCGGSANYFDFFGPAITPSTYDIDNDEVFEVSFTEDTRSTCGSPLQTTYRFTKQ